MDASDRDMAWQAMLSAREELVRRGASFHAFGSALAARGFSLAPHDKSGRAGRQILAALGHMDHQDPSCQGGFYGARVLISKAGMSFAAYYAFLFPEAFLPPARRFAPLPPVPVAPSEAPLRREGVKAPQQEPSFVRAEASARPVRSRPLRQKPPLLSEKTAQRLFFWAAFLASAFIAVNSWGAVPQRPDDAFSSYVGSCHSTAGKRVSRTKIGLTCR